MPILDVDKSDVVVVIKRSLSPGFAKIANPLFAADNALMLFGDGREAVVEITKSLQSLLKLANRIFRAVWLRSWGG